MKISSTVPNPDRTQTALKISAEKVVPRRFATVALIGVDGSGKSSVAKALLESCPLPMKYLYMGTSIESSNIALPTSRLVHRWKVHQHKKSLERSGKKVPEKVNLHGIEHRDIKRGKLGAFGRLLLRVSEESYRQFVSWIFQLSGKVVLYDRHFLFDVCPVPTARNRVQFADEVHRWFLRTLYPRPELAIFLDAPAEILYARKREVPIDYLEQERKKLAQKGCYAKKFVAIDTTRPLDEVIQIVNGLILDHCARKVG